MSGAVRRAEYMATASPPPAPYVFLSIARIEFGIGGGIREVPLIDWRPSEAIVRGTGTNRLLLRCAGTTLTAMVNGAYLATVEDTADLHGAPFVYAGARINQSASSDARFDNLLVVRQ